MAHGSAAWEADGRSRASSVVTAILGTILTILCAPPLEGEVAPREPADVVTPEAPVTVPPVPPETPTAAPPPTDAKPAETPAATTATAASSLRVSEARDQQVRVYLGGIGLGAAARWGRRGAPTGDGEPRTLLLVGLQARLLGYASNKPLVGGGRRFVTPDLRLSVDLGQAILTRSRVIGIHGAFQIGIGRSLATRVSPYGRLQVDTRFAAYLNDIAEGNSFTAALRGSGGVLWRILDESVVILGGAAIEGVAGAQRLGPRSTFAQMMHGAELMIVAQPGDEFRVMLFGDVRTTRLGERVGGRRLEGRASLEVGIDRVSLFLWYTGTRIAADLPLGDGASFRELRRGHALQLGLSVGL